MSKSSKRLGLNSAVLTRNVSTADCLPVEGVGLDHEGLLGTNLIFERKLGGMDRDLNPGVNRGFSLSSTGGRF